MTKKKDRGYLVETKSGKTGKIFPNEKFVNEKIVVHIEKYENPILCDPKSLKIIDILK